LVPLAQDYSTSASLSMVFVFKWLRLKTRDSLPGTNNVSEVNSVDFAARSDIDYKLSERSLV
jgi:hypothetical protein